MCGDCVLRLFSKQALKKSHVHCVERAIEFFNAVACRTNTMVMVPSSFKRVWAPTYPKRAYFYVVPVHCYNMYIGCLHDLTCKFT